MMQRMLRWTHRTDRVLYRRIYIAAQARHGRSNGNLVRESVLLSQPACSENSPGLQAGSGRLTHREWYTVDLQRVRRRGHPTSLSVQEGGSFATRTCARSNSRQVCKFFCNNCTALRSDSTKVTAEAPRLSASIPTAPVPAYKSRKRSPNTCVPRIEKIAPRTLSDVGRSAVPCGPLKRRPRWDPAITRIHSGESHFWSE